MQTAQRLAQDGARGGRRPDQGFMLSAARSVVFNAIVGTRVDEGTWNRLLPATSPTWMDAAAYLRSRHRMQNWKRAARARDSPHCALARRR
jgi:tRNA(Glu) U13 pseudouridine synthase TruD